MKKENSGSAWKVLNILFWKAIGIQRDADQTLLTGTDSVYSGNMLAILCVCANACVCVLCVFELLCLYRTFFICFFYSPAEPRYCPIRCLDEEIACSE